MTEQPNAARQEPDGETDPPASADSGSGGDVRTGGETTLDDALGSTENPH